MNLKIIIKIIVGIVCVGVFLKLLFFLKKEHKNKKEPFRHSILDTQVQQSLSQPSRFFCKPFLKLGRNLPRIVKQQRLQQFNEQPDMCMIRLDDPLFDNNRDPKTACRMSNPRLYQHSGDTAAVMDVFAASTIENDHQQITADDACIIKFNPDATVDELVKYSNHLSSQDPSINTMNERNRLVSRSNTELQMSGENINGIQATTNTQLSSARQTLNQKKTELTVANNTLASVQSRLQTALNRLAIAKVA